MRPVRFVSATSLFDGHDASINIVRRFLQREGAEVIHLGHNRSVEEVLIAALQEDADAIAVSSYQGGHNEYFRYLVDQLREHDATHIRVFGGGGGVIVDREIRELMEYGVERIYSPDDGRALGLDGMARDMIARVRRTPRPPFIQNGSSLYAHYGHPLSRWITALEEGEVALEIPQNRRVPVVGFTGVGGAGKSSLLDEFLRRFRLFYPELRIALLSVDPTQRKTGGALLGDRLRLNAANDGKIFVRSLATRSENSALSPALRRIVDFLRGQEFDLILIESAGTGQADTAMADLADFTVYVMTPEFGAATQLEKIAMLDYADMVILNKADRVRAEDALYQIRKQYRRNHALLSASDAELPVFPTIANRFGDPLADEAFAAFIRLLQKKHFLPEGLSPAVRIECAAVREEFIPPKRVRYLAEIADAVRSYHQKTEQLVEWAAKAQAIYRSLPVVGYSPQKPLGEPLELTGDSTAQALIREYNQLLDKIEPSLLEALRNFDTKRTQYAQEYFTYQVRGRDVTVRAGTRSLSGTLIPKVALPQTSEWAELVRFLRSENLPGEFPYTAGVFPFKREGEEPTRMFAGEGSPERTNRRFHLIAKGQKAARLSTAFDSITLYGEDPAERPDIYGKIGNAGVSIATLDDMKKLYSGFDLSAPTTSVSMTINGPAPTVLAFFMNAAIDQEVERYLAREGKLEEARQKIKQRYAEKNLPVPRYCGGQPEGHNGLGLALLGLSGDHFVPPEVYHNIRSATLAQVRGTVQADILKEDQAQNTCIFSTEFSLKAMGDVQEYFIANNVTNFYSVSVSGYHIAEAGANPITQVAFTLANGFTLVEYYLQRGMRVDDFARNFSFFFSNGMDPEYAVIGRAARRIWAIAMRDIYHAGSRAQMLKYHIQTSGRSLHAQEISFNDIRTTLQALYAIMDNCNSLHTNAYDEAVTTPTPESVRRAIAIQLIINRELGLTKNENPLQGSYFLTQLTNMVEEAILQEFERLADRGGVLGAMETMYQRNKIQEESLYYEKLKASGELPIIGVNTFLSEEAEYYHGELMRSTEEEKKEQIAALRNFQAFHAEESPRALAALRRTALQSGNIFAELMETVKCCSLGQITNTLYEVGGRYRRSM